MRERRRLYLLRHAEVSYVGEDGPLPKPAEVSLNEEGREQAGAAAAALAGIRLDRVLASGLPRTVETAEIVAPGHELERWPELREISGQVNRMMSQVDRAIHRLGVHAGEPIRR